MTPEQTPTSNVDWEWYERGILEERKRQRAHIDTLTAALEEIRDLYVNDNIRPAGFAVRAGEIAVKALEEPHDA